MCVLNEILPPAGIAATDQLVDLYFPMAPGTLAQLDAGTTFLLTNCGEGAVVLELARRFPRSLFAGIDHSDWNIACARREAQAAGLANVWFEAGDITTHRFGGIFHLVASLDDEVPPLPLVTRLAALHRSLRRGGTLFLQPPADTVSHRLLEAGFASVRRVAFSHDPARPLYLARR